MKHFALCFMLLTAVSASAQEQALKISVPSLSFDSAAKLVLQQLVAADPEDTTEGGNVNAFRRWTEIQKNRVAYDAPEDSSIFAPANRGLEYYMKNINLYCTGTGYKGNWKCLGPYNNYYGPNIFEAQGMVRSLWVDTNIAHILAGADQGGLWETHDTGHRWRNITDPSSANGSIIPGTMGVTQIAVNPTDHNIIYLATNMYGTNNKHGGYALGLSYSEDGGQSWESDGAFPFVNAQGAIDDGSKWVKKLAYMPGTEKLFAITSNRVLYKASQNDGWTDITPSSPLYYRDSLFYSDLEFSVQSPGKVIVSSPTFDDTTRIFIYNTGNQQWTKLSITAPSGYYLTRSTFHSFTGILDCSVAGTDSIYFLFKANQTSDSSTHHILFKTAMNNVDLQQMGIDGLLSNFEFIVVSPANSKVIYGTVHDAFNSFYRSTDRGQNFSDIQASTHADARAILLYHADADGTGLSDIVFGGSDGGVVMKKAGNPNFESITGDSLAITQFYSLANTDADERYITGGAQDNGNFSYIKDRAAPWKRETGGDGFVTRFANNGVKRSYMQGWPGSSNSIFGVSFNGNSSNWNITFNQPLTSLNFLRPMYFDNDTNFFFGVFSMWKRTYSAPVSISWVPAFSTNPKEFYVNDVAMSEPGHDTVYMAYRDPSWGNDPTESAQVNNPHAKLYRTFDEGTAWINITPAQVAHNRINSIVVNKKNLKNIWVAMGDVNFNNATTHPDDMNKRVYYSNNFGTDWIDISKGLPPLPVNKILYHEGFNRLYCATDVGVFTCDFSTFNPGATLVNGVNTSVAWECFSNGMPPCVATDMELNYCAGKLRISTFGRGIWETQLYQASAASTTNPQVGDLSPTPTEIISANTTWSSDKYITTGIRVLSGATLTINTTGNTQTVIHMPKNGLINVEPGGTLIIDSARITNDCSCMWGGIKVYGNSNVSQFSTINPQGKVIIHHGSIIEHARFAVSNWKPGDLSKTGGIIQAVNSAFRNNHKSVEFAAYYNTLNGQTVSDISYFKGCIFTIDNDYKGDAYHYYFVSHASLWEVTGVRFTGCAFKNEMTYYTNNSGRKGYGINSYNAGYTVNAICTTNINCTNGTPCSFENLQYGILAEGDAYYGHPVTVTRAVFSDNTIGIRLINFGNLSALGCKFNIGGGLPLNLTDCDQNIGIYASYAHTFHIEENE